MSATPARPRPTIFVLNGPILNLLGVREPHLYGHHTLADIERLCRDTGAALGFACDFRQSNHEGFLVDWIHEARDAAAALVINPAGLSFRSIPLLDALKTFDGPIAEIHLTNIHRREPLYRKSLVSLTATGVICGFGAIGYALALRAVADQWQRGRSDVLMS